MYRVTYHYDECRMGKDTYKTEEEAVEAAIDSAATDLEGAYFEVSEVKSRHRSNPIKQPVVSAVVSEDTFTNLLDQKKDNT